MVRRYSCVLFRDAAAAAGVVDVPDANRQIRLAVKARHNRHYNFGDAAN